MRRKGEKWILIGVLALAFAGVLAQYLLTGQASANAYRIAVEVNGARYATLSPDAPQTIRIEQDDGSWNEIEITDRGVRMKASNCKNQLCVRQGELTAEHRLLDSASIVCLPHRVVIFYEKKETP